MNEYQIGQIVESLSDMGVIRDTKMAYDGLKELFKESIAVFWTVEDVLARAEEKDIELSKEDAIKILENVEHYHDATVGINWDVLDFHIEDHKHKG